MSKIGLWIYESYRYIFDHNVNPLRNIPNITHRLYIMTVLAFMWSAAFSVWMGGLYFFGWSVWIHCVILTALFFTISIFSEAERNRTSWFIRLKNPPNKKKNRCVWDLENEG